MEFGYNLIYFNQLCGLKKELPGNFKVFITKKAQNKDTTLSLT